MMAILPRIPYANYRRTGVCIRYTRHTVAMYKYTVCIHSRTNKQARVYGSRRQIQITVSRRTTLDEWVNPLCSHRLHASALRVRCTAAHTTALFAYKNAAPAHTRTHPLPRPAGRLPVQFSNAPFFARRARFYLQQLDPRNPPDVTSSPPPPAIRMFSCLDCERLQTVSEKLPTGERVFFFFFEKKLHSTKISFSVRFLCCVTTAASWDAFKKKKKNYPLSPTPLPPLSRIIRQMVKRATMWGVHRLCVNTHI